MLALENVSWTAADGEEILRNISLEVPDGKMTVITGPNGGGKTSLAKLIAGLVNPTEGKILLDGKDITDWDMTERARGGISYAFQQPVRFKDLQSAIFLKHRQKRSWTAGKYADILEKWDSARKNILTEWWTTAFPEERARGSRSLRSSPERM